MNKETSRSDRKDQLGILCGENDKSAGKAFDVSIAENLKRLRAERKISQPKLAARSGVSQQLISQIERSENLSTKALPALAEALGVEVYEIDPAYATKSSVTSEILKTLDALDEVGRKELLESAREIRAKRDG